MKGTPNPETRAFLCKHVDAGSPVLLVVHERDGDWQFLCGAARHSSADGLIAHVKHIFERDATTITEVGAMPKGFWAERNSADESWEVHESDE